MATAALFFGCSGPSSVCRVGSDCASGVCNADGTCAPSAVTGGSTSSGGSMGASGGDASSSGASAASSTGSASTSSSASATAGTSGTTTGGNSASTGTSGDLCVPDDTGVITRSQVPLQAGLHANYRIAQNASFDTTGQALTDGGLFWNFTPALSGDTDTLVTTQSLDGGWFAGDFADATYVTPLSSSSDDLGVFKITSAALLLEGVVSPTAGTSQTELTYSPAVTVLQFPISSGATWHTSTTVQGTYEGLASYYFEDYQSTVDAQGAAETPYATFPVLRVNTLLTRTVGGLVTTTRTDAFVTDCFGTIASVTSQSDETAQEFSQAAEVRRLTP